MLTQTRLEFLAEKFKQHKKASLTAEEFMVLLKNLVPLCVAWEPPDALKRVHEQALLHGLYKLFVMMDIDCDGRVDFEEFSNYLVSYYRDSYSDGDEDPDLF